jgi:hypothetical protein
VKPLYSFTVRATKMRKPMKMQPVAEYCETCRGWHIFTDDGWHGDPAIYATKKRAEERAEELFEVVA